MFVFCFQSFHSFQVSSTKIVEDFILRHLTFFHFGLSWLRWRWFSNITNNFHLFKACDHRAEETIIFLFVYAGHCYTQWTVQQDLCPIRADKKRKEVVSETKVFAVITSPHSVKFIPDDTNICIFLFYIWRIYIFKNF